MYLWPSWCWDNVVPQNFLFHFSQDMLSKVLKYSRYSRVDQSMLLLSQRSITRVLSFSRKFGLQRSQFFYVVLHRSSTRFVSSFKSYITSLLSQWLRWLKIKCSKKSTMANIQSNFMIFLVNIKILKSHSSFYQGLIMIHQDIAQKSKVAKLGFWSFL